MVAMMERYQGNLEQLVAERTDLLEEEKRKTEALLHRMLPKYVTDHVTSFMNELYACNSIVISYSAATRRTFRTAK